MIIGNDKNISQQTQLGVTALSAMFVRKKIADICAQIIEPPGMIVWMLSRRRLSYPPKTTSKLEAESYG